MFKFLPTSGFKLIDRKEFNLNKYTASSLKGRVLKVNQEYSIDLCKIHNVYPQKRNAV